MWQGQAFWVCPALCGCELSITADWVKEIEKVAGRRVSYQHPVPKTITAVELSTTCALHEHFKTDPLPADPYGGSPGYINPIPASPTSAEKLYIQLYRYNGQRFKPDTCGCKIYQCIDRFGVEPRKAMKHAKHSMKCAVHSADDDSHTAALEENFRKNDAIRKVIERFPRLTSDDVKWSFDQSRLLELDIPGLTVAERAQSRVDHDVAKVKIK